MPLDPSLDDLALIGITSNQWSVYKSLIHHGPQPVLALSRNTGMNRVSLYGILDQLTQRGFVYRHRQKGKTAFIAEPPIRVLNVLEENRKQVEKGEAVFRDLIPGLLESSARNAVPYTPKVYVGRDGIRNMQAHMISEKPPLLLAFISYESMALIDPERVLAERSTESKIHKRIIYSSTSGPRPDLVSFGNTEYHFVPTSKFQITSNIFIYGDTISILSSKPRFEGIELINASLARTLESLHAFIFQK